MEGPRPNRSLTSCECNKQHRMCTVYNIECNMRHPSMARPRTRIALVQHAMSTASPNSVLHPTPFAETGVVRTERRFGSFAWLFGLVASRWRAEARWATDTSARSRSSSTRSPRRWTSQRQKPAGAVPQVQWPICAGRPTLHSRASHSRACVMSRNCSFGLFEPQCSQGRCCCCGSR